MRLDSVLITFADRRYPRSITDRDHGAGVSAPDFFLVSGFTAKQIGLGAPSPARPCHTTGHGGPHPAVRRVEPLRNEQTREAERVEALV